MPNTEVGRAQAEEKAVMGPADNPIDFEKLHSALRSVHLLSCRGSVVRVAGLRVESNGPAVGLGDDIGAGPGGVGAGLAEARRDDDHPAHVLAPALLNRVVYHVGGHDDRLRG